MTIKSGQQIGIVGIAATDTTLTNASVGQSREVYSGILHNTGSVDRTIEIFLSADASSAAAERIFFDSVAPGQTMVIPPVVIQAGYYLIGVGSGTGVNFYGAYTLRTGTDI